MPSPILARADALMQRRRQSGAEGEDVPVLTDAVIIDEEDIPVLQEIAGAHVPPALAEVSEPALGTTSLESRADPAFDRALLDIIAHELARRVNDRLNAELPALIEATVRDFLAEREMLELIRPRD